MKAFNIEKIRKDFPVLQQQMKGKRLVYFDNGAMGLTPEPVINTISQYYRESSCNIHRGIYELSETTTDQFEQSRETVSRFLHSQAADEIVFTHGATESANLIAYAWGEQNISEGDEILISEMEHHANVVPWQLLARRKGAVLRHIPVNPEDGSLRLEAIDSLLSPRSKLLAISGMSNVTGVTNPLEEIISKAHAAGAVTVVDAAQLSVHHRINVQSLDADFLFFSAHKLYGPTGVGILYGKRELLKNMPPFLSGGDMIQAVKLKEAEFREAPYRFEAGTPHIAGVFGLKTALEYVQSIGFENIIKAETRLMDYALQRSETCEGLKVFGPKDSGRQGSVFSFNLEQVHPHDVGTILNEQGIAVRAGFHCAQPYVEAMGSGGTVRASMAFYNTVEEIDRLFEGIQAAKDLFGSF